MLAEAPVWIVDVGKISASVGAALTTFGVIYKLPWVQRERDRRREAVAHEQRTAHTEIVRGVLDEHVTPKIDALTVRVTSFDERLTAHMADEDQRLDKSEAVAAERHEATTRRLTDVEEQLADHLANTAVHGLPRPGGRL